MQPFAFQAMSHPINVRLPKRLLDYIDSQTTDITNRSHVIRVLLDEAIAAKAQPADRTPEPSHR
jgi:metal-responsive CopG/Arc/MetJ family transcriptional regulator